MSQATVCDVCGDFAKLPYLQLRFQMQLKEQAAHVIDYTERRDVCRVCAAKPLTIAQLQGRDPFAAADAVQAEEAEVRRNRDPR